MYNFPYLALEWLEYETGTSQIQLPRWNSPMVLLLPIPEAVRCLRFGPSRKPRLANQ